MPVLQKPRTSLLSSLAVEGLKRIRASLPSGRTIFYEGSPDLQKRYYILFVARDEHGELKKINIPLPNLHIFAAICG